MPGLVTLSPQLGPRRLIEDTDGKPDKQPPALVTGDDSIAISPKELVKRAVASEKAPTELLDLPTELHLSILHHLSYPSVQQLRATNRYFQHLLTSEQLEQFKQTFIAELVQEDLRADFGPHGIHDKYICFTCFREKPDTQFARKQISGRRCKGHPDAHKRFCSGCGIKHSRWPKGVWMKYPGGGKVHCHRCEKLEMTSADARKRGLCLECFDWLEEESQKLATEFDQKMMI